MSDTEETITKDVKPEVVETEVEETETKSTAKTPLHPLAGAFILGIDWLLFSGNVLTGGLATPIVVIAGFVLGYATTYHIQRNIDQDSAKKSKVKAIAAGLAVGFPMPIFGTALGGAILGWSGLTLFKNRFLPKTFTD
jgi:hypothetical protein